MFGTSLVQFRDIKIHLQRNFVYSQLRILDFNSSYIIFAFFPLFYEISQIVYFSSRTKLLLQVSFHLGLERGILFRTTHSYKRLVSRTFLKVQILRVISSRRTLNFLSVTMLIKGGGGGSGAKFIRIYNCAIYLPSIGLYNLARKICVKPPYRLSFSILFITHIQFAKTRVAFYDIINKYSNSFSRAQKNKRYKKLSVR